MTSINAPIRPRADLTPSSSLTVNLLSVLLTLLVVTLLLVSILFILRRRRRAQKEASLALPTHKLDLDPSPVLPQLQAPPIPTRSRHRRTPSTLSLNFSVSGPHPPPVFVFQEKQGLCSSAPSAPSSPIPEIRITFPDEIDDNGRRQSGRVVVVHIGENGEGLEPLDEELPEYQKEVTERFEEVDLDTVGGLREK